MAELDLNKKWGFYFRWCAGEETFLAAHEERGQVFQVI